MKVLVVGGGGREHAIAWGLARSPKVTAVIAAPGNAGIGAVASLRPEVRAEDLDAVVSLAEREGVDLVVIGPEGPLVAGLADDLRARGIAVFGPDAAGARLEGSKAWSKEVMARGGIPTARARAFRSMDEAVTFVDELGGRAAVKADGLASGKGVTVAADRAAATAALGACLVHRAFGDAGATVVVEEVLEGPELSAFVICDGVTVAPLALSRDFKRSGEGDTGPNTGGMGAFSPVPGIDATVEEAVWNVARRSVAALAEEGLSYRGLLYVGLILTSEGPKVLEYNCRFGDPEAEAVVPRLSSDLAELLHAAATEGLGDVKVGLSTDAAVTVVLTSGGYPGRFHAGAPIEGLEDAAARDDVLVFHAGTEDRDGTVVTAGGRVIALTALGATVAEARARAYDACAAIRFEGMTYRRDIALAASAEGEGRR